MSLTLEEVEHIANLARLDLTDAEKEQYRVQLSAILDYAQKLQQVDTSGIPATSSVLPPRSVLREDKPVEGLQTNEVLQNAPEKRDDQFQVPAVFE